LLKRVATLPRRSAVVFAGFAIDGTGRSFLPQDVLPRIASAANAPTYIASDDVLESGAVGGDVISFEAVGKDSGKLAARILAGENPATMAITESSARAKVLDARQLNRWAIPLSHVPPGSLVMHREPTLWEAYRWWIAAGISLILLQTGLIATLLVQRRLRRLAEANLGISEAHGRAAVLEERNRMARDRHDTLAQGFTGVIVQLEAAQQAAAQGSERDVDGHIQRANALARYSLGEARRSIRALRPKALENTALCLALDEVTKQMTAGTNVGAQFTINGPPRALIPSNEDNLLRIYQEILTNALRHSGAKTIESSLSFDNDVVRLDVRDDGAGFELARKHEGLGLLGIRERVSQMKGELIVESQAGTGTRVRVTLPD
jgi:signal transduction histidine kinase